MGKSVCFAFAGGLVGLLLAVIPASGADPDPLALRSPAMKSRFAAPRIIHEIRGTNDRNNPLRLQLRGPFTGDELFVRFRLRYAAESLDTPETDEGEFFVLWIDRIDGGDRATHNGGIPNLGIHVTEGQNRFMVRYDSRNERFSKIVLEGDREYEIVGRLRKSRSGAEQPFDDLALWVDPEFHEESEPDATVTSAKSISSVKWIGFSTGRKTEPEDRIHVFDIGVAQRWDEILGLPPRPPSKVTQPPEREPVLEATVDFATDVLPILKRRCFRCHSGTSPSSGQRLDVYDELLNFVSPRDAARSPLIELLADSNSEMRMPPDGEGEPLPDNEVALLRTWIDEGVAWNEELLPTPVPESDHWAFQPVTRPDVPELEDVALSAWVRNPIDAFIGRRIEAAGVRPASPASDETLVRRLWLDLVGLPPHEAVGPKGTEIQRADEWGADSENTFDQLIERLLASPQYGERWGRHWLDVVRWAESNGHQHNRDRPHAWRYRDYVVACFNSDKPFDRFLKEQVAGDELPYADEHLIATGFLSAARYSGNELDKQIQRNDILVDVVNTTAKAFLGLTLECAQCHSHKFDPISIRDYYRFQAFFSRGQPGNVVLEPNSELALRLIEARWQIFDGVRERLVEQRRKRGFPEPILVLPKAVVRGMNGREREFYQRLERNIAKLPQTWGWYSPSTAATKVAVAPHEMRWPLPHHETVIGAQKTYLLVRGDPQSIGPEVQPGWPAVFGPTPATGPRPRTILAEWLASPENPLTARVWVNRLWQWHFGRGLVTTPGDFGTQGQSPTHPELLDWLACELIDSGWSTKHIHRLIVQSNTYRQSSAFSKANYDRDPANATYWRWQPRRLEAEAIRDSILCVAAEIDHTVGGPSVPLSQSDASCRRSMYLQQKRDNLPHQQTLFDGPNAVTSCSRRTVSTVPLQPLYLLNSDFMQKMAREFADRIRHASDETETQIELAFRRALSRPVDPEERQRAKDFLETGALEDLCLVLLNLNEFVYIP